jgi:hypothetical protein
MRSRELGPDPGPAVSAPPAGFVRVARSVADRFVYPVEHPFQTLFLYYAVLTGIGAALVYFVPGAAAMISGERLAQLINSGGILSGPDPAATARLSWMTTLDMALAMIGALVLMLPTSWVYMTERRRKGFDQSMVQTMIVLSVAIAGVVVIVRNSTALAFSLTGIVAAVRFRNNLSDTRDTLYIFTGIGVGLSAGVQALAAALVLSAIFNFIILIFYRGDYGMCELGRSPGHLLIGARATAESAKGDRKKRREFNAVLVVRAADAERARPTVEAVLTTESARHRLAEVEVDRKGKGILKYLIRIGRRTDARSLEDALLTRGAPFVIGARIH